jgi:hypothetical protein
MVPRFLCELTEATAPCIRCEQRGEQRILEKERREEDGKPMSVFVEGNDFFSSRLDDILSETKKKKNI